MQPAKLQAPNKVVILRGCDSFDFAPKAACRFRWRVVVFPSTHPPPCRPPCPLATVLSFQQPSPICHPDRSEPGFPATQHETKPRMRLSLKERRMKSANAIKTYRKSGVAEGRDLQCAIRVPHFTLVQPLSPLSFVLSAHPNSYIASPNKVVILSASQTYRITKGFMAPNRRACPERRRRNPGNACYQMLLRAFRPRTANEGKSNSLRAKLICSSADLSWKPEMPRLNKIVISPGPAWKVSFSVNSPTRRACLRKLPKTHVLQAPLDKTRLDGSQIDCVNEISSLMLN